MPHEDLEELFHASARISSAALSDLVRQRGRWEKNSEEFAEVLLALHSAGLGRHQLTQEAVKSFATAQRDDGSWGSDFDQTAYGIMVAAAYPAVLGADKMSKAAEFIVLDYGNTALGHSWSDEVGKTLLGLKALAIARHPRLREIAADSLLWLETLMSSAWSDHLINERYTAEFVAVVKEVGPSQVQDKAKQMTEALLVACENTQGTLWNNDLRANGITLEATASLLIRRVSPAMQRRVIDWFQKKQRRDGSFGSVLATARIIQGLAVLQYEIARQGGLDEQAAQAKVALAHRGVTDGIPLALLWKPMRLHHDTERQARVLIVPDRLWKVMLWLVGTAISAIFALLASLFGDLLKQWILFP